MAKVTLCIGHCRLAPGAYNESHAVSEYKFNTWLCELITKELKKFNHEVYIVNRLKDGGGTGMKADVKAVNKYEVDCIVELHCNAFNGSAQGCEMLYYRLSERGKKLAQCIQNEVVKLGFVDRNIKPKNVKERGGLVLRDSKYPMVIGEPFFIDNMIDWNRAVCFMPQLAKAYAVGINNYLKGI